MIAGGGRRTSSRTARSADGFAARQLTPAMVDESDLVLTATKAIRSRVLEDSPGALRRTFTVLELAALLDVVGADSRPGCPGAHGGATSARGLHWTTTTSLTPTAAATQAHAVAAELMTAAVERIAKGLTS